MNEISVKTEFSHQQNALVYPDGVGRHWWHLARNHILYSHIRRGVPEGSAMLEIGCARGVVVQYLRRRGLDCHGVEPGEVVPLAGMEKFVHTSTPITALPPQERERYETVLLLDVIEHLSDPAAMLRSLKEIFPRLSRVLITVPARPELWSNFDEFCGHYCRYTDPMLKEVSSRFGWELSGRGYFFHLLYLPMWVLCRLGMRRRLDMEVPRGLRRWAHQWVAWVMILDHWIFPGGLAGASLLAWFHIPGRGATES